MARKPSLERDRSAHPGCDDSIVFAVYAPFGGDPSLSLYPRVKPQPQPPIGQQELVRQLQAVAALGVNVSALVDLYDDDTWLVEIPAGKPQAMSTVSAWKQDMSRPQALAGFLRRVHDRFRKSRLVLSLEGHGAGYLPEIDFLQMNQAAQTDAGSGRRVQWTQGPKGTTVASADASPVLPLPFEILPPGSPGVPSSALPLSSWGVAEGLRSAIKSGVPRPAVVHFSNCFNAALEHLHAVAPYADFATGYANYDYFTAGITYPKVFSHLAGGGVTAAQLAAYFALENGQLLHNKGNHPSIGATVPLARLRRVAVAVNTLAEALTHLLQTAPDRAAVRDAIQLCARRALQYDSDQNFDLEVPDQVTDLGSFARSLSKHPRMAATPVPALATVVLKALAGFKQYGEVAVPYLNTGTTWDFSNPDLALSVFFPDPELKGQWDWRSPYYMASAPIPGKQPPLKAQVPFLQQPAPGKPAPWVEFIREYHKGIAFKSFLPAPAFVFPIFDAKYVPPQGIGRPPGTVG